MNASRGRQRTRLPFVPGEWSGEVTTRRRIRILRLDELEQDRFNLKGPALAGRLRPPT
jgi:hypothetical protein